MKKVSESLIIGIDISENDKAVLIVGRQKKGKVDIVNAFQGNEAIDLYSKLISIKKDFGGRR